MPLNPEINLKLEEKLLGERLSIGKTDLTIKESFDVFLRVIYYWTFSLFKLQIIIIKIWYCVAGCLVTSESSAFSLSGPRSGPRSLLKLPSCACWSFQ